MAKSQKPHQLTATTTLLIFYITMLLSQSSLSASSRLLHEYPQSLSALTEPEAAFGIALPSDKVNVNVEADDGKQVKQQRPCQDHMEAAANKISETGISPNVAGKYRPLALNILPKGTVPPSGPSKGTNDVKN